MMIMRLKTCSGARLRGPRSGAGFSLLELLIVIFILALAAAAVTPGISAGNQAQVDLASEKVAAALRFTRSEAIRTGIPHGIVIDHDDSDATGQDIVVYQLDTGGNPFRIDHVVFQPVSKQPYDIRLLDAGVNLAVVIRSSTPVFNFDTVGRSQHLHFDPSGRPVHYASGAVHRLRDASITIGEGAYTRSVTLGVLSGQVAVQ